MTMKARPQVAPIAPPPVGIGPLASLKLVLGAPRWILGLWLFSMLIAWFGAGPVRSAAEYAMGGYAWLDDGHLLGALSELLEDNPAVGAAFIAGLSTSILVGALGWVFAAGGIFSRLDGRNRGVEAVADCVRYFSAMLAQTLWGLFFRALILALGYGLSQAWGPLGWSLIFFFVWGQLSFDQARANVVRQSAHRHHVKVTLRAFWTVLRRPKLLVGGALLIALQQAFAASLLLLAAADQYGSMTPMVVRLLALLPLVFSLWRISAVLGKREAFDDATTDIFDS